MKNHKQKFVPNPSEVSILHALTYGNAITRLSLIICGLANFLHKQFLKGIVFFRIGSSLLCLYDTIRNNTHR